MLSLSEDVVDMGDEANASSLTNDSAKLSLCPELMEDADRGIEDIDFVGEIREITVWRFLLTKMLLLLFVGVVVDPTTPMALIGLLVAFPDDSSRLDI